MNGIFWMSIALVCSVVGQSYDLIDSLKELSFAAVINRYVDEPLDTLPSASLPINIYQELLKRVAYYKGIEASFLSINGFNARFPQKSQKFLKKFVVMLDIPKNISDYSMRTSLVSGVFTQVPREFVFAFKEHSENYLWLKSSIKSLLKNYDLCMTLKFLKTNYGYPEKENQLRLVTDLIADKHSDIAYEILNDQRFEHEYAFSFKKKDFEFSYIQTYFDQLENFSGHDIERYLIPSAKKAPFTFFNAVEDYAKLCVHVAFFAVNEKLRLHLYRY